MFGLPRMSRTFVEKLHFECSIFISTPDCKEIFELYSNFWQKIDLLLIVRINLINYGLKTLLCDLLILFLSLESGHLFLLLLLIFLVLLSGMTPNQDMLCGR